VHIFHREEYTTMRRSVRIAVATALGVGVLLVAGEAGAQYRYTDAKGVSKVVPYKVDVPTAYRDSAVWIGPTGVGYPALSEGARETKRRDDIYRGAVDVKSLAGDWRSIGGTSAAAIRIKPDGSYEGVSANGGRTVGKISVLAGKASFQSANSAGTVMWFQEGGKDVLFFVRADGRGSAKLERVK
jgi:hypothetical protein